MVKNQRGNSIIEIVIGTTIVTITSLAVFNLFITNKKITQKVSRSSACQNQVNTIISKFASMGTRVMVHDTADDTMYTGGADVPPGDHTEPGLNATNRWPNDPTNYAQWTLPTNATDPVTIRTANLIRGSHSAISSIYNSSVSGGASNFCTDYRDYVFDDGDDTLLPSGNFNGMTNVQSQLRIEPYDIITKATLTPCTTVPPPVILAPLATSGEVDPTMAIQGANVRSDIGFLVSIRTTYDSPTGQQVTCTGQIRLEYPADDAAPAEADNTGDTAWDPDYHTPISVSNYAYEEEWIWPGGAEDLATRIATNPPDTNDNSLQIEIGYTANNLEAGSVLVCRDTSTLDGTTNYNIACLDASDNEATWMPQCLPSNACESQPQFPVSSLHDTTTGWVNCEDVEVCGVAPDSPGTWSNKVLTLSYSNLPVTCNANITMLAVDVSGNRRFTNYYAKIPMPGCGTFCDPAGDPQGYFAAAGYPNGYFHENPACPDQVGAGSGDAILVLREAPDSFDFGTSNIGTPVNQTLTIENIGSVDATLMAGAAFTGDFDWTGGGYPGGGSCGGTLSPASTCTIGVTFTPTAVGLRTDTLQVDYDNGSGATSVTATVTGNGVGGGPGTWTALPFPEGTCAVPGNGINPAACGVPGWCDGSPLASPPNPSACPTLGERCIDGYSFSWSFPVTFSNRYECQ